MVKTETAAGVIYFFRSPVSSEKPLKVRYKITTKNLL